jgi:hypothetical protein
MADFLTTTTKLINTPPGQLAAVSVLAGIVWEFKSRCKVSGWLRVRWLRWCIGWR